MQLAQNQSAKPHEQEIESEIDAIRAEVCRIGIATMGCEQLRLLCPDHMSVPEQYRRVAEAAAREGWSFAFLPDGTVRFGFSDGRR